MKLTRKQELITQSTYKKPNELINLKGKGTALGLKTFAMGVSHMSLDSTNNYYTILTNSELRLIYGKTGSMYKCVKELTNRDGRGTTLFDWIVYVQDDKNERLIASQVITDAVYSEGQLLIRYNNSLNHILENLSKDYTLLKLNETLAYKSLYALRLNEILVQFFTKENARKKTKGATQVKTYNTLTELKIELGIINAEDDKRILEELGKDFPDYHYIETIVKSSKYKDWRNLRRDVILKGVDEINMRSTDIHVEIDPITRGRTTVGVRFIITKAEPEKDVIDTTSEPLVDVSKVMDEAALFLFRDLTYSEIADLCKHAKYDIELIRDAYEYFSSYPSEVESPIALMKWYINNKDEVKKKKVKNNFNNIESNSYDFQELEEKLLDN